MEGAMVASPYRYVRSHFLHGSRRKSSRPHRGTSTFTKMARAYDTLSEAVNDLIARGYKDELTLRDECVICGGSNTYLHPDEFAIDEFHRFEGESNPSDESIVYAISSQKHNVKGVLVNAFGLYAGRLNDAMVKKLTIHR